MHVPHWWRDTTWSFCFQNCQATDNVFCNPVHPALQLLNISKNTCSSPFVSVQLNQTICKTQTHFDLVCLSPSPSTDSMIRVGGDYQAQIPEFKPGKLREGKTRHVRRWRGVGNKIRFINMFWLDEHKCFVVKAFFCHTSAYTKHVSHFFVRDIYKGMD